MHTEETTMMKHQRQQVVATAEREVVRPNNEASINSQLQQIFPELSSKYAQYPMEAQKWLYMHQKDPEGNVGFIKSRKDRGPLEHYVYGKHECMGNGYFHFHTREAWEILKRRMKKKSSREQRKTKAWIVTRDIIENRAFSYYANDVHAEKAARKRADYAAEERANLKRDILRCCTLGLVPPRSSVAANEDPSSDASTVTEQSRSNRLESTMAEF